MGRLAGVLIELGSALSIDPVRLLGPIRIRELAEELGIRPTKTLGQNFVHDANTVRRIVDSAGVGREDHVVEVGPGLGSLTLGLLANAGSVTAVEIDPVLAGLLPRTVAERAPSRADALTVVNADALSVAERAISGGSVSGPTALVANLPYNVAVPVLLHMLATFPTIRTALVMVQLEVAQRLAAAPGGRVYGVPSVKARFFGDVTQAGTVGANVFWPIPKVESGLVRITRTSQPWSTDVDVREPVFAAIDAAFAQRRKTLRSSLASWAGSPTLAEKRLRAADIDPTLRGERLSIEQFVRLAATTAD